MVKNLPVMQETWVQSLGWEDPLEKRMATHLATIFLPGETHGQRILANYSPWGHKELDTTKRLLLLLLRPSVMSDPVRPHRRQPTRLPHPWDSPGKNTGVGCHFLLQCMKVESGKWKWSRSVVSDSQRPHGLQPTRLLHPWDFPGKSTGVGCHCLLQQSD